MRGFLRGFFGIPCGPRRDTRWLLKALYGLMACQRHGERDLTRPGPEGGRIVYASRIPPRPIGGWRPRNSLICGRQILQNRGPEPSKIVPGSSWGHQTPLSGAPRAASWAARVQPSTHFDTRRAHLGVLGPQFGAPEGQSGGPGGRFRCPGLPF